MTSRFLSPRERLTEALANRCNKKARTYVQQNGGSSGGSGPLAWADITGKPSTFAPTIGSTASTAVAGNDSRLTNARTPTAHTHDEYTTDAEAEAIAIVHAEGEITAHLSESDHFDAGDIATMAASEAAAAIGDHEAAPDPHPGYALATALTSGLSGKSNTGHSHAISDTTGLQTALDGKAASGHTHTIANVTSLQTSLDNKSNTDHTHSQYVQLANQLGGSASNPDVRGIRETAGPTLLTLGAVADGEYLRRSGATLVGGTPSGGGGSAPKYVRKAANQTHALVAYANVTDLVFALLANTAYNFRFLVAYQSAATTTGIGLAMTFPASPTSIQYFQEYGGNLTAATAGASGTTFATAADTGATSIAVQTAATSYKAEVEGLIVNGANAGNLQLRVRAEVAAQVTIMAGSYGVLTQLAAP
jgi:hypothetical protein